MMIYQMMPLNITEHKTYQKQIKTRNPNKGDIKLNGIEAINIAEIKLFDQLGQFAKYVSQESIKSNSIDIPDLKSGLFFADIITSDSKSTVLKVLQQ